MGDHYGAKGRCGRCLGLHSTASLVRTWLILLQWPFFYAYVGWGVALAVKTRPQSLG